MESRPLLSLCIPTNGILEWVFSVLESIYKEANEGSVELSLFEVIVTDNGDDQAFREKICRYQKDHANLRYQKTAAVGFLNEAESYKLAGGLFIKFINHRTCLVPGALHYWLRFIEKYQNVKEKPVVYFSNGVLAQKISVQKYSSFDEFVRGLSYFISFKIRKQPCSYNLEHIWDSLHVFYSSSDIYTAVGKRVMRIISSKFCRRLRDFVKI